MSITYITVTERQTFKRCRRRWDIQSNNRQGLARIDTAPSHFSIGTAVHLAFSAHVAKLDPRKVVEDWLIKQEAEMLSNPNIPLDVVSEVQARIIEDRTKTLDIIEHYYNYWSWDNPLQRQNLEYIAAEVPLRAAIPHTSGFLVGTLDGIAVDETGGYWIIEHKTYSTRPDQATMDINDQMTAYCWLFREVFGVMPRGVLYDGIAKKLPTKPKLLKDGSMSKQWIDTTAATYLKALEQADLDPADYAEFIARLEDRDAQEQNPFFTRWHVYIPHRSLDTFQIYLAQEYSEMVMADTIESSTVIAPDTKKDFLTSYLYPNFQWQGCWDCTVKDLCRAIQFQEDYSYLVNTFYVRSSGHETIQSIKIGKGDYESPLDLKDRVPDVLIRLGYYDPDNNYSDL